MNIILVHIGTIFPKYMIDNIFQLLCIGNPNIYIVISNGLLNELNEELKMLSKNIDNIRIVLESELRTENDNISKYMTHLSEGYRDNFWNTTTTRFYYITKCIEKYLSTVENIVHIETDVLLYDLNFISLLEQLKEHEIYMVKDHEHRVIPSIIIYKNLDSAKSLSTHITEFLFKTGKEEKEVKFYNDMHILSKYKHLKQLPHELKGNSIIFDGASIGQYLCGIDPRNIQAPEHLETLKVYNNPKMKFINETFEIMKDCSIERKGSSYMLKNNDTLITASIINLHIHSKQLWTVNNTNSIRYKDVISGDRILESCNTTFTTPLIEAFHKNLEQCMKICLQLPIKFTNEHKIVIENAINKINNNGSNVPFKIFVYSNYIKTMVYLLKKLEINKKVYLYLHNSDDSLEKDTLDILNSIPYIERVYCQNLTLRLSDHDKLRILPIGLANRMYPHGSIIDLCQVIEKSYKHCRTKNLYIQMSNTHSIRTTILSYINNYNTGNSNKFIIQSSVPYREYLEELSKHYFSLCPRGNGIDTHRFWESLYLGVIPVVLVVEEDRVFYDNLKSAGIPFHMIDIADINNFVPDLFTKQLYDKYVTEFGPIQTLECLKLSNYIEE